jgi:hypothetical protein
MFLNLDFRQVGENSNSVKAKTVDDNIKIVHLSLLYICIMGRLFCIVFFSCMLTKEFYFNTRIQI